MIFTMNLSPMKLNFLPSLRRACLIAAGAGLLALPQVGWAADEQTFASSDQAVDALVMAAKNDDTNAFHHIFGPVAHGLISADAVQADQAFKMFVQRLTEKTRLINNSDSNATLEIGLDGWPFPIPLVKQDGQWFFDTVAGGEEILNRRIGMDELGAIAVCEGYVDAQREYATADRLGDGVLAYAQFLLSTPGTHDGLYWPAKNPGEELSPLGPLIAEARAAGYRHSAKMLNNQQAPYHGYYFKILTRQGKHAPGGKYNYLINDRLLAGFALVAWPAKWGNTGVMTFIVNQEGNVYQKNLGPKTVKTAAGIKTYDPDESWTLAK
jgi:hypothetical protein